MDKEFVLFQSPELVKAAASRLGTRQGLGGAAVVGNRLRSSRCRRCANRSQASYAVPGRSVRLRWECLFLRSGILIGRAIYLDSVPTDILSPDAATAVIDTVLVPLRTSLRAVALLGVVVGLGAYLIGGSSSAIAVRRGYGQALDFVRHSCKRPNAESGGAVGQSASCPTALCHHRHRRPVAALLALPHRIGRWLDSSSLRSLLSSHWKYWFVPHAPPRRTPGLTTAEPTTPGPGQKIRKLRQRLCLDGLEFLFVDRA